MGTWSEYAGSTVTETTGVEVKSCDSVRDCSRQAARVTTQAYAATACIAGSTVVGCPECAPIVPKLELLYSIKCGLFLTSML